MSILWSGTTRVKRWSRGRRMEVTMVAGENDRCWTRRRFLICLVAVMVEKSFVVAQNQCGGATIRSGVKGNSRGRRQSGSRSTGCVAMACCWNVCVAGMTVSWVYGQHRGDGQRILWGDYGFNTDDCQQTQGGASLQQCGISSRWQQCQCYYAGALGKSLYSLFLFCI